MSEKCEWVRAPADTTLRGSLCGICDSMAGCSHPRVRCAACGKEGLQENWPFDCCDRSPRNRKEPREARQAAQDMAEILIQHGPQRGTDIARRWLEKQNTPSPSDPKEPSDE